MDKVKRLLNFIYVNNLAESEKIFSDILQEKKSQQLSAKKRNLAKDYSVNCSGDNISNELNINKPEEQNIAEMNGEEKTLVSSMKKHLRTMEPHLARHKILSNAYKRERKLDSISKEK